MDELNLRAAITLPSNCNNRFCGIAFDGCFFYLTAPQEFIIYKFKRDFTMAGSLRTDKPYNRVCYDNTENCFWAAADNCCDIIYKLDCDFKEIDLIHVKGCQKSCPQIAGISYNCEKDTLLIAYCDHIAEVQKLSGCACIIQQTCSGFYTGVLSAAPYYAAILQDENGRELQIFGCDGCHIKSFLIPACYSIDDVLLYPCGEGCPDELVLVLLATKHNRCQRALFCGVNACDMVLCRCNCEICCAHCKKDEKEQCACDLIESIALVETALAHILNAEGEKLQKAVELAGSADELLAINKSVTRTILDVVKLEQLLHAKLEALSDICRQANN